MDKQLICEFIHHWGADNYIRWCSPETDMEEFFEDDDIWAAQFKYNNKPRTIPHGLQVLNPDPYKNKIRDKDGKLIPESLESHDIYYDVDHDFISMNGIVHYIVLTTCKVSMPNLLKSKFVADAQRTYLAINRADVLNARLREIRLRRFCDDSASSPVVGDGGSESI